MVIERRIPLARALAFSFTLSASFWITACLKVDVNLDQAGGGTMRLEISDLDAAGHERIQKQLVSPSVKLVSIEYKDRVGQYEVSFEDSEKLRTAPLFQQLRVQHGGLEGSHRTFSMTLPRHEKNPKQPQPQGDSVGIDLTITVPGTITETNGNEMSASKSNWKIRKKDMFGAGRIGARMVYKMNDTAKPTPASDTAGPASAAPPEVKSGVAPKSGSQAPPD